MISAVQNAQTLRWRQQNRWQNLPVVIHQHRVDLLVVQPYVVEARILNKEELVMAIGRGQIQLNLA
jgi:hypothetical protein